MRFGVALPHSGPLASVPAIARVAREAERLGYESVWVHDHINYDLDWLGHRTSGVVEDEAPLEPNFYESVATLAHVSGFTSRVKLGTAIIVLPLRDPRVLARQALTVQALSGGRLVLGLGTGDYPADFRVMGIPYARKGALTDEYLDVLRALLPGGRASYAGETIAFQDAALFPVTDPIPLLLGGGIRRRGDRFELFEPALRRVARWCDGWIPEGPPELVAAGLGVIRRLAAEYGRDAASFEVRPASPLYLHEDDEVALARLGRGNAFELVGSVASIVRRVADYRAAGATALNVRCFGEDLDTLIEMIGVFAREVMG